MDKKKHTAILSILYFDETTIQEAEKRFLSYKDKRVILAGSFDDDIWRTSDEYANHELDFNIDKEDFEKIGNKLNIGLKEFKKVLKTYIISQFGVLVIGTMQSMLFCIKKLIKNYSKKNKALLDETTFYHMGRIQEFFSMLPIEGREKGIEDIINEFEDAEEKFRVKDYQTNQRTLAAFESYFRFNEILKKFWEESADIEEKLFFFPVWMWWNVSGILPLRPREFILTPRNCISEENGEYFLTVRRNKIKGSKRTKTYKISNDYELKKYQIPEELKNEITWYINQTSKYVDTELNTLFIADVHYNKWSRCKPYTSRFFTYINLRTCLRYFFEQIIEDRYGYTIIFDKSVKRLNEREINYLSLGDTRHLALINLIFEGATPMVAMMLAGHDNPEMSSHYYSNIATLIECKTYRQFKKMIKGKETYRISGPNKMLGVKEFAILENSGRCYSQKFQNSDFSDCYNVSGPAGEIGYCQNCKYYRSDDLTFHSQKDMYRNKIFQECANLSNIVKKVRASNGEKEDIIQVLLRLKDAEYSYQQFLEETQGEENDGEE